jgi:hypothetical protein
MRRADPFDRIGLGEEVEDRGEGSKVSMEEFVVEELLTWTVRGESTPGLAECGMVIGVGCDEGKRGRAVARYFRVEGWVGGRRTAEERRCRSC